MKHEVHPRSHTTLEQANNISKYSNLWMTLRNELVSYSSNKLGHHQETHINV